MAVNLLALTTVNRTKLYQGQPGTGSTLLYTAPGSTDVKVTSIIISNTTGVAATISLAAVTVAGTAGATNRILNGFTIAANDTVTITAPVILNAGDFLSALQGTAASLTVSIFGETYA